MKGMSRIILGLSMTYPLGVLAQPDLPPPPPLEAYIAYKSPPPPIGEALSNQLSWLNNFYISGKIGYSLLSVNGIEDDDPTDVIPTAKKEASGSVMQGGVGIGYRFRPSGVFSRVEIEYINRGKISYDANPLFIFPPTTPPVAPPQVSLTSNIHNQTLFAKAYYDIDFGYPVVPYAQIGLGLSHTTVNANGLFILPIPEPITVTSTSDETKNSLGGDAGLGVRFRVSPHFFVDLGYEFDYLGNNLTWIVQTEDPTDPFIIKSGIVYSNSFMLSLTLQG